VAGEPSERIIIQCVCGAKLRVRAAAIGKKTKCPKCEQVIEIAAPGPAIAPAPASTPVPAPKPKTRIRPAAAAVETPAPILMPAAPAAAKPSVVGKVAKLAGPFVLGCVLSGVGALIGAGIWFAVAAKTGYEIGYIAWGVGVAAGFGMAIGYRDHSTVAGVVAVGMSLFGILAAKLAIFAFVLYASFTGNTNDIDLQRNFVASQMVPEILQERGIKPDDATEAQEDAAYSEAEQRAKKMKETEIRSKCEEYRKAVKEAKSKAQESGPDSASGPVGEPNQRGGQESVERPSLGPLVGIFFQAMFGLIDILFVGLAVMSAFKIASGRTASAQE
jgi:hypothetical protein